MKNRVVFITGASSGIGEACAMAFAAEGYSLILTARRRELLEKLADKLRGEHGVKVHTAQLDVRSRKDVKAVVDAIPETFRDIDVLINNAGLARGMDKFQDNDDDAIDEVIDTNVKGLIWVTKAIVPIMIGKNSGTIINIGSIAGREAYPGGSIYCASKHAVSAITKSLRMDLVNTAIRISTIDPGMVETNFSRIRFHGDETKASNVYKGLEPLSGKDIADAALFIASRPAHVVISEIVLMPVGQASATIVHRKV